MVVARSCPSTQTSTPAGSVTKKALAMVRIRSTCSALGGLGRDAERAGLGLVALAR